MASQNNLAMEKQQILQQQATPKCPRCDSSNTKFCYYNNYSMSQPRHFCKACKRYWTRGGTLRNVPVGGGCRKNKRVKKAAVLEGVAIDSLPSSSTPMTTSTTINPNSSSSHSQIYRINSLFYGLNSNISSSDHNLSFSRFNSTVDTSLYDLHQPQVNVLGFSSPTLMASTDVATSKSIFSSYVTKSPMFRSSSPSVSVNMVSSNLEPEKSINPQNNIFGLVPNFGDMEMEGNNNFENTLNQMEATNDMNSSLISVGGWFDSANISYSVPSLI